MSPSSNRSAARNCRSISFLNSLASACGSLAAGVVLSGTGSDGAIGLKAISDNNGFVIAQDPAEALYDGMPRSAIDAGVVDLVLRRRKSQKR